MSEEKERHDKRNERESGEKRELGKREFVKRERRAKKIESELWREDMKRVEERERAVK